MDLSKWMGKPSSLAIEQISDVEEDVPVNNLAESSSEARQQDDESRDIFDRVNLPTFSKMNSQVDLTAEDGGSPSVESGDGIDSGKDDQVLGSNDEATYRELPSVFVEIRAMDASSGEEYEYLPGHFIVGRILQRIRRRGEDIYKIQLRSGEHDQVSISYPRLPGPYQRSLPASRRIRRHRSCPVIYPLLRFYLRRKDNTFSTTFRTLVYHFSALI